ncbi:hypothetical protein I546_2868 [Mycobacterium kansasii 732]|nr:hypothetical protein I546_2868 [Mycobacterium kansasii 732]
MPIHIGCRSGSALAGRTADAAAETASLTLTVFGETGTLPLSGTAFGGIAPALLTFLPEQHAEAIGAPVPVPPTM